MKTPAKPSSPAVSKTPSPVAYRHSFTDKCEYVPTPHVPYYRHLLDSELLQHAVLATPLEHELEARLEASVQTIDSLTSEFEAYEEVHSWTNEHYDDLKQENLELDNQVNYLTDRIATLENERDTALFNLKTWEKNNAVVI